MKSGGGGGGGGTAWAPAPGPELAAGGSTNSLVDSLAGGGGIGCLPTRCAPRLGPTFLRNPSELQNAAATASQQLQASNQTLNRVCLRSEFTMFTVPFAMDGPTASLPCRCGTAPPWLPMRPNTCSGLPVNIGPENVVSPATLHNLLDCVPIAACLTPPVSMLLVLSRLPKAYADCLLQQRTKVAHVQSLVRRPPARALLCGLSVFR